MKGMHWFVLAITATVFLGTFLASQGLPTGLLVAEQPEDVGLKVVKDSISDGSARIEWKTNTKAVSTLVFNGEATAFAAAKSFSHEISGLDEGAEYAYRLRACSETKCDEKAGTAAAEKAGKNPITGAVAGVDFAGGLGKTASYILYGLLGAAVIAVAGRIGYEKVASRDPMEGMVKKAEKLIENEQHEEAYRHYLKAREAYKELEKEAKVKHYEGMMRVYENLRRYAETKEAQRLAEKYSQGTITAEEMRRLNEILAG